MKKAYFQYYETFEDILAKIKDSVKRDAFRRVIIRYGLYGTVPTGLTEIEDMAWGIVKDLIDQQQHRREVNRANRVGKKIEPAAEKTPEAEKPAPDPKPAKEKSARFIVPTIEEVKAFCETKGLKVNVNKFYLHYESNGWHVGKNKMKSWQAAVQKWAETEKDYGSHSTGTLWNGNSADAEVEEYAAMFK